MWKSCMHQYAKNACTVIESYIASCFLLHISPYIMISYVGSLICRGGWFWHTYVMNLRVWKLGCAWYKLCHLNVTFWITFFRCLIWLLSLIIKLWKHNDDTGQKFSSFPWTSLSFVLLCSFEDHKFRSLMPLNFLMYFMLRALLCK